MNKNFNNNKIFFFKFIKEKLIKKIIKKLSKKKVIKNKYLIAKKN